MIIKKCTSHHHLGIFGFGKKGGRKFIVSVLILCIFPGLFSGCFTGEEQIREPLIQQMLELRKKEYQAELLITCKKDIAAKAEKFVDSLISEEISFRMSDSIIFPEKPIKPEFLGPVIISDSSVAKPIF